MKIFFLKTIQVLSIIIAAVSLLLIIISPGFLLALTLPMVLIFMVTEKLIRAAESGSSISAGGRILYSMGAVIGGLVCGFGAFAIGSIDTIDSGKFSSGDIIFIGIGIVVAIIVTIGLLSIVNNFYEKSIR